MTLYQIMRKHAVFSIVFIAWALALTTWVTYQVFADITAITTQAAAAYATLFGLPTLAFSVARWRAERTREKIAEADAKKQT